MLFQTKLLILVLVLSFGGLIQAQETPATPPAAAPTENPPSDKTPPAATGPSTIEKPESTASKLEAQAKDTASKLEAQAEEELKKFAKTVDQDPRAKTAAAGILQPIYVVAENLAFPAFHWLAFALMSAGVFSYALQLVLGKLVVLLRMGFSFKEIASDLAGFAISVVGLVLTTQAAAENSTFTQSPAAVISATAVGAVVGIILYLWGQAQELEAVAGRSKAAAKPKK